MNRLLMASIVWLSLGTGLFAQEVVVFAKGDSLTLTSGVADRIVTNRVKAEFLSAFKADLAQPSAFEPPAALTDLPNYGRKVPGASGEIRYHASFHGGFVLITTLEGLIPNHRYIFTLNGNPQRAGNTNLMETVSQNAREKYYDFQTITTDATGRYHGTYGIVLPEGPYDVRFYVKDTTDFKIVLYRDFFKFTVE